MPITIGAKRVKDTVWHEIFAGVKFRGRPIFCFVGTNFREFRISDLTTGNKFSRISRTFLGLATKIPKNGLKIFPEFLQKCSKNLRFHL